MKIEVDVYIPQGYEYVDHGRPVEKGEKYMVIGDNMVLAYNGITYIKDSNRIVIVKDSLWRAEPGGTYFCVLSNGEIYEKKEEGLINDDSLHRIGNYFETKTKATLFLQEYIKLLENFGR